MRIIITVVSTDGVAKAASVDVPPAIETALNNPAFVKEERVYEDRTQWLAWRAADHVDGLLDELVGVADECNVV